MISQHSPLRQRRASKNSDEADEACTVPSTPYIRTSNQLTISADSISPRESPENCRLRGCDEHDRATAIRGVFLANNSHLSIMTIRAEPIPSTPSSAPGQLSSIFPRLRLQCSPMSGRTMRDDTMWRGRKRSRSASSEGCSVSSSPDRTGSRWNVAPAGSKGEKSGWNCMGQGGLGESTVAHARSGKQDSQFSSSQVAPSKLVPNGVSDQQTILGWHEGTFDLVKNTGVPLNAEGFDQQLSVPPSPPALLPLTPALSSASLASHRNAIESSTMASRPKRKTKRQRLARTIGSNDTSPLPEQPLVPLDQQEGRSWVAGSSAVESWNLASCVEMSGRHGVVDVGRLSGRSDFEDNKGIAVPLLSDLAEKLQCGQGVDVAESREVGDPDQTSNDQYLTSNAFLHDLHLQRRARNRPIFKQNLDKYDQDRSFDTAILPPSPSISSSSTASVLSTEDPNAAALRFTASELYDIAHLSSLSGSLFTPNQQGTHHRNVRHSLGSPTRTLRALSPASSGDEDGADIAVKIGVADTPQGFETSVYEDMNRLLGSLVIQRHGRRR
ncbi:hypothetical protein QFC22_006341 [Naganishia vaughanmartiniae]|uniref:Uncharacterized protein n=1 Tax=Naganishia vaughanmartiniae TaxID=1424756 RepID=A0ACC2WMH2_9TREE|nr:hypothetical protein QFC22_006341 [Naganishia vaughanmartiniae]